MLEDAWLTKSAYCAYARVLRLHGAMVPAWEALPAEERAAWHFAIQAVRGQFVYAGFALKPNPEESQPSGTPP